MESMGIDFKDMFGGMFGQKSRKNMTVGEARRILLGEEEEKLIDRSQVESEALKRVEEAGIVFLDEIDKIASREDAARGPDVSREGVQRDLLPIVEGSTVATKYGVVRTDHVLFIAAGCLRRLLNAIIFVYFADMQHGRVLTALNHLYRKPSTTAMGRKQAKLPVIRMRHIRE